MQQGQRPWRPTSVVACRPINHKLHATVVALVSAICGAAHGHENSTNAPPAAGIGVSPARLEGVIVEGRGGSLVGIADSAAQGTVGAAQLAHRPYLRPGEILETIPGVIITQHSGGGKANQYFLRGFNLDHGTDFLTTLDGMPLNLPSHGHGQGYTDMNAVIPEFLWRVSYEKGVYYAHNGDFSSAGAAHLETFRDLPHNFVKIETGMYGYGRAVFGTSPHVGNGVLLMGGELYRHDGPWENPDDYERFNALVRYSVGDDASGYSFTARGYRGEWDATDQIATSAVDRDIIDLYGTLEPTSGGDSQRYSLQGEWHSSDDESATRFLAFGFYYDLDLFSNFTYFLDNTAFGDQFEQTDRRWTAGLDASHTLFNNWFDSPVLNIFGLQARNDDIRNGLFLTDDRDRYGTVRQDDILQTSVGIYYENRAQWAEKFRTVAGVRGDFYHFDVDSDLSVNSDERADVIGSPKLSLIFGPWARTEVYLQGGLGFHSNDGRGTTTEVEPGTLAPGRRADPLVQTYGAEVGVRSSYVEGLQSSVSLWWLDIDSELLFIGDAGATEATRPSRRYGVEFANFYRVTKWLTLDADVSFSHARFRDDETEGDHIPGSIESVLAAGFTIEHGKFFGSMRLRYFGPRPLNERDSVRSDETIMLNAQVGYHLNETWTITAEVLNMLDRRDHDIDYYYESHVRPGDLSREEIHFHPVEPIQARVAVTARF